MPSAKSGSTSRIATTRDGSRTRTRSARNTGLGSWADPAPDDERFRPRGLPLSGEVFAAHDLGPRPAVLQGEGLARGIPACHDAEVRRGARIRAVSIEHDGRHAR